MTYSDFIEVFGSVDAFSTAINSRKVQKQFAGAQTSSDGSESFTGTTSYEAADNLLTNGDTSNLDKITAVNIKNAPVPNELKNTLVKSVCGGVPLVPPVIMGVPKNMLTPKKAHQGARVVNLVYNCTFGAFTPAADIVLAGAKVVSLVKALEARKIRVNLYTCVASRKKGQTVCTLVKVKKAAAPLNMLRIAYPCINPSFLRRSWFRWLETCPAAINRGFVYGYGEPVRCCATDTTAKNMILSKVGKDAIILDGCKMINTPVRDKQII